MFMAQIVSLFFYYLTFCGLLSQNTLPSAEPTQHYGICTQTFLAVRGETKHESEQVTQLVFGDIYKVIEFSAAKDWAYIENAYDHYKGWIPASSIYEISAKYYSACLEQQHLVAASHNGYVLIENQKIQVPIGSTLPFYEEGFISIDDKKYQFEGKTTSITKPSSKVAILATARSYLGTPYLWGGKTTKGIDCSGFTQMVFKQHGYRLPRDSYQQAEIGQQLTLREAKAGDIAFFQRKAEGNTKVVHVGIYLGNGQIIHADGRVRINRLDATGIYREDLGKYSHYLKFLRRLEE